MRALGNWNEPVFGSVPDQSRVIEPTARADLLKSGISPRCWLKPRPAKYELRRGVGGPLRIGGRCGVNLKIRYRAAMNGDTVASAAAGLGRNHQADALRYRVQQKQRSPGWLQ